MHYYTVIYYVENPRDLHDINIYGNLWSLDGIVWKSCACNTMDGIDVVFGCVWMHLVGHATIVHL